MAAGDGLGLNAEEGQNKNLLHTDLLLKKFDVQRLGDIRGFQAKTHTNTCILTKYKSDKPSW